ncbi:hypothetical protein [Phytohabitans houttuyneae]|uniref:hypothetical protein n=1 Tax=Phytohabitans houttuyneae TaxID=1076126 RepID=UPI001562FF17|nr:hypothetical protein [Phytohabitans houttuyneae]
MDGAFARLLAGAHAGADAVGDVQRPMSLDSTIVGAHQHAAGGGEGGGENPANRTLGRNWLMPSDDFRVD